jgi:hypothetical protein
MVLTSDLALMAYCGLVCFFTDKWWNLGVDVVVALACIYFIRRINKSVEFWSL